MAEEEENLFFAGGPEMFRVAVTTRASMVGSSAVFSCREKTAHIYIIHAEQYERRNPPEELAAPFSSLRDQDFFFF